MAVSCHKTIEDGFQTCIAMRLYFGFMNHQGRKPTPLKSDISVVVCVRAYFGDIHRGDQTKEGRPEGWMNVQMDVKEPHHTIIHWGGRGFVVEVGLA